MEDGALRLSIVHAVRGETAEAFSQIDLYTNFVLGLSLPSVAMEWIMQLQHSPFLQPLHADPRWTEWLARVRTLHLDEVNFRVVAMLREHLLRHPELYPGWAPHPP